MKRIVITILIFMVIVLLYPFYAAMAEGEDVLIIYNDKEKMELLDELITAFGKTPIAVLVSDYQSSMLDNYKYVVLQDNKPLYDMLEKNKKAFCVGNDFISIPSVKIKTISKKTNIQIKIYDNVENIITAPNMNYIDQFNGDAVGSIILDGIEYPFGVITKRLTYIPYFNRDDLSVIGLGALLNQYLEQENDGQMYVLIDEIYPFSDLRMLIITANKFYENGIPFILSVMPIYDNVDYPAFLRYAQVLRYIQSKNGSIIMHAPLIRNVEMVGENLEVKLNKAYTAYKENNVTIFEKTNKPLEISLDMLGGIISHDNQYIEFPINTMLKYQLFENEDELDNAIKILNRKWLHISDYKMNFTDQTFIYEEEEIDGIYTYKAEVQQSLRFLFDKGNQILTIIVAGSVFILIILMIMGYKLYNNKFMKEEEQE